MPDKYGKRLVAFIDILGFSALIKSIKPGDSADTLLSKIEAVLTQHVVAPWTQRGDTSARMFSDCICFSAPPTLGGFLLTITRLMNAQTALLQCGLLVRGAITTGRHYESARMIFSEALVRAYNIERTVACYPRIILDTDIVNEFYNPIKGEDKRRILANPFLLRDADGQVFVNYLSLISGPAADGKRERYLEIQRALILKEQVEHAREPSVMAKLAWVVRYHNFISQRLHESRADLVIGSPETQGFEMVLPS